MEFLLSRLRSYVISFNTSSFWVRCGRCGTPTRPSMISMNSSHDPPLHHRNLSRCLSPADRRLIKFRNHGLKRRLRSAWYFFFFYVKIDVQRLLCLKGKWTGEQFCLHLKTAVVGIPSYLVLFFLRLQDFYSSSGSRLLSTWLIWDFSASSRW